MNPNTIPLEETWDLSLIYDSPEAFGDDLKKAEDLLTVLAASRDDFANSRENFLRFNENMVSFNRLLNKLYNYAHLHCDKEPAIQDYQYRLSQVLSLDEIRAQKLDWVELAIIAHQEDIKVYLEDEAFRVYRYSIAQTLRDQEHLLTQEMETLLSEAASISDVSGQVFDAFRLDYDDIMVDGQMQTLNSATLTEFLKHRDQSVRRLAYTTFYKEYKRYENVFAATLSGIMKKDAFYAKVRRYNSPLAYAQWDDDVPEELFYKILDKANKQYRPYFHRYNQLKKRVLGLDQLYNYDLFTPLVKDVPKKYTIDECFAIILEVVSVFGDEYTDIIKQARKERWIDFHPIPGKRTGAYSSGCYDTRPYILMNYIGDYNSLSTMIHELGHSCHTYLSAKYQHPVNADYRIFVAEVASTVNETLLINYMLEHAKTKEEKAYFLYELLENCVGLIYRQPMYAQFEDTLHQWAAHHEPMNASRITTLYQKLNEEYYGEAVINDELVGHSCFYIPHFYYNYYVYKYTLGMTVALAIVSRILKGDQTQIDRYLNFLKSGGSASPLELLKTAGVDPLEDAIYDDAYHYFNDILNQLEEIL